MIAYFVSQESNETIFLSGTGNATSFSLRYNQ